MCLKKLLFVFLLSVSSLGFADANHHSYPQEKQQSLDKKNLKWPGYCEIEIINQSHDDIHVTGFFDDGTSIWPFNVYAYESPHYISLYYYGYCHVGMEIDIDSLSTGVHLFGGYVRRNSTIRVVPYFDRQAKVEVRAKS